MSSTQQMFAMALVAVAYALAPAEARGDEFQLANGGSVRGVLIDSDRVAADDYTIESDAGVTIRFDAAAVERVIPQLPANEEYEARRDASADTVQGQWELAQWCLEQSLSRHRRVHLERVIALDPDHKGARSALEYFFRDGRWVTQKEINTDRGLVLYKTRWITPQKARILEDQEVLRDQEGVWHRRIQKYAQALRRSGSERAAGLIQEINDPAAVKAIEKQLLSNPSPTHARLRQLALAPLAAIGTPAALELLAGIALYDNEEELRLTATEHFQSINSPDIVGFFVSKLSAADPQTINRAATVLATLGDDLAVGPLIDVLVTTRRRTVTQGTPGGIGGAGFGDGGGGLSAGSSTYIVNDVSFNADVYEALLTLTGVDFGERDVAAWKRWHASTGRGAVIDTRRD